MTATFLYRVHFLIEDLKEIIDENSECIQDLYALTWHAQKDVSVWLDAFYHYQAVYQGHAAEVVWNQLYEILNSFMITEHSSREVEQTLVQECKYFSNDA